MLVGAKYGLSKCITPPVCNEQDVKAKTGREERGKKKKKRTIVEIARREWR